MFRECPWGNVSKMLLVLLLLCSPWQLAHALDGNELNSLCENRTKPFDRGVCIGYMMGVGESLTHLLAYSGICAPDDATIDQIRQTVVRYLNERPQQLQRSAVNLVWSALAKKWPCLGLKTP